MARILVQTDDYHTVLDERDVQLADVDDAKSAATLLDRLEQAVRNAERSPVGGNSATRRAILPASDYRVVSG